MDKAAVKSLLLEFLPDADIRTDQCEIVRINWRRRMAFISQSSDEWIRISVYLLIDNPHPDSSPIDPSPRIEDEACNDGEAAEKAAKWLKRIVAASI